MFEIYPADAIWSLIVFPIVVLLLVVALFQVAREDRLSGTAKIAWLTAMILLPIVGPLAWFAFGNRNVPQERSAGPKAGAAD